MRNVNVHVYQSVYTCDDNMYECQICKQYARKSLKEIVRHIREVHRSFSTPVSCGVDDCTSSASSYESLRQHLYKKHRSALIPEARPEVDTEVGLEVTFPGTEEVQVLPGALSHHRRMLITYLLSQPADQALANWKLQIHFKS